MAYEKTRNHSIGKTGAKKMAGDDGVPCCPDLFDGPRGVRHVRAGVRQWGDGR